MNEEDNLIERVILLMKLKERIQRKKENAVQDFPQNITLPVEHLN